MHRRAPCSLHRASASSHVALCRQPPMPSDELPHTPYVLSYSHPCSAHRSVDLRCHGVGGGRGGGEGGGDGGGGDGGGGDGGGDGGGGEGGGGDGGGGVGAGSLTTTVTPCAIVTSGLVSTVAPSIEDKLTNDSVACASALATRAEVFDDVLNISSCKYTLAAVTCSVVWHSGG